MTKGDKADWQFDEKALSGTHKTGITFTYVENGIDGTPQLEILHLQQWMKKQREEGKSGAECNDYFEDLREEFITFFIPEKH